jgi:hypothetical protein
MTVAVGKASVSACSPLAVSSVGRFDSPVTHNVAGAHWIVMRGEDYWNGLCDPASGLHLWDCRGEDDSNVHLHAMV